MTAQTFVNALIAGLSWGLLAMGFSIIHRTARFFHVAHAATYLTGAYVGIWLLNSMTSPVYLAAFASLMAAAILGAIIEIVVYRPLRSFGSSSLILFLASLALLLIVQNTIALTFGSEIQTVPN